MELKSKKQGEVVQSKWKYRQLMNFIAPFTGSRGGVADICSNNDDDRDNPDSYSGSTERETTVSEPVKTLQNVTKFSMSLPEPKPQVTFVTQLSVPSQENQVTQPGVVPKMPPSPQRTPTTNTGQKRKLMSETLTPSSPQSMHMPTKWLVKDNGTSFPPRPRDEDELFLLSFVPALKRLAPQKRCETKMKIQQIMYEAEFNVAQTEQQERKVEPEKKD